ncbi:hypothetical protein MVEG_01774 [Podila verticillata NRRL 6337]|nr:hypothetical protein MVEG_01774 [Podila verticillata NRRL 6337]
MCIAHQMPVFYSIPNDRHTLTTPTWMLRLSLCLWLVATIESEDNVLGEVCEVLLNFELAAIMQYIKILPKCVILFFFLEQIITLHRISRGIQDSNNHWRRLGLINSSITFLVIVSGIMVELIAISQHDYLLVTYSMVNVYQATLVVFIVEE